MPNTNLLIGFAASALVLGTVGAVAIEWDPRDREASEQYRHDERERADRFRSEVWGIPRARENEAEREERRRVSRADREEAREARRAARAEWWEGIGARFETGGLREALEDWGSWWREEAAPAWQEWADEQDARLDSRDRTEPPSASEPGAPAELPAAVERILEESLPPEEAEAVRREARSALDWWAEERERMRSRLRGYRPGDREDR